MESNRGFNTNDYFERKTDPLDTANLLREDIANDEIHPADKELMDQYLNLLTLGRNNFTEEQEEQFRKADEKLFILLDVYAAPVLNEYRAYKTAREQTAENVIPFIPRKAKTPNPSQF